jgi:glycosyltransferase involved in cell wall biosynthesis
MDSYADFIRGSRGEFTAAKDIYVRPHSGWFSDRSVCYLASGRPVITMNTGFDRFYPAGEGLFEFTTIDEVLAALDTIDADYPRQSRAAREMAAEYFAADRVVSRMMSEVGL